MQVDTKEIKREGEDRDSVVTFQLTVDGIIKGYITANRDNCEIVTLNNTLSLVEIQHLVVIMQNEQNNIRYSC